MMNLGEVSECKQLSCLPLAQNEQGLSWASPWSDFIILSALTNQPGSCNGAHCAIFSVAVAPKQSASLLCSLGLS